MHANPAQRDSELSPEPDLALTPEPPLVHVLKELGLADLQTAITGVNKLVMQSGDVEHVGSWTLLNDYICRCLIRDLTTRRQQEGARAASAQKRRKLTEETHQDALRRAPEEAERRGVKNSKKLVAQLIGVSTTRVREWEAENGK